MTVRYDPVSLRLFLAVARSGSISAAAALMHIALAAASRRIVQLEADVGVPLLERHPRGVALNAAGEALLRHAQDIEDAYERMRGDMTQYGRGMRGRVRVAANSSSVLQFLPEDLHRFRHAYPDLRIELKECASEKVVQAVQDGTAEVGICVTRSVDAGDGLQLRPYRQDKVVLLVPRDHPLSRRKSILLEDALGAEFVAFPAGTALRSLVVTVAHAAGCALNVSIEVRGFEAMTRMVAAGLGVAVLPLGGISMHQTDRVKVVHLRDDWAIRQHCIALRPAANLARPALLLADFLAAEALKA